MFKRYFVVAFAAVFALAACSEKFDEKFDEKEILPSGPENVHTLSVGIEAGAYVPVDGQTKASTEAVIRVKWQENDTVSVVNATTGKLLGGYLLAQESGVNVTFTGTVTGTITEGNKLYYIYPRVTNNEGEVEFGDGHNISLAGQKYDGNNIGNVCFYGYAEDVATTTSTEISKKIQFNLVTSYAHLNMASLPAKGADLSSLEISNVNEGFTWTLTDNTLTAAPYDGSNSISVTCANSKITQSGNAVVRFAIPASAESGQDRVITVNKAYKNDGYVKAALLPAAYYNQLYTNWKSNVSVAPQTDKTEVTLTNEGSTDVAEGVIPVADAFVADKLTEIGIGGVGTITFDATASAKIKENADDANSTNVFFKVEDVTETKPVENVNLVYEVTMKTVDGNGVEVFGKGKAAGVATVTVPLGEDVQDVTSVKLVNDSGVEIEGGVVPESVHFENGILFFKVNHFSKYAIKYTSKETPGSYVAQIGSRKYTTLAGAIAAAQNGNTIQLLCDCLTADGVEVTQGKKFTLDLGGHTYKVTQNMVGSGANQCFQLPNGSEIVFRNGTISTSCAVTGICSSSSLTIENVTVDMSASGADNVQSCFTATGGSVSAKGGTCLVAKGDTYAVMTEYSEAGGDIDVEINTAGEIKGKIKCGNNSRITVKNGRFDASFEKEESAGSVISICGGVFKASPEESLIAGGYEKVANADPGTSQAYPFAVVPINYKVTLLKGSDVFGQYNTIAEAVEAFNFSPDITAGEYTLSIVPGTYNEDMILFIQDYTQDKKRSLKVQSADENLKVTVKSTSGHRAVFGIAAESDYSGGPISFRNIDFDVSENTNAGTYVIYFAGSQSGEPDLIFPEPTVQYNRRYGHNISFDHCDIVGNGTSQAFVGETGTGAIKVENCEIKNCIMGFNGYFVLNSGYTAFGLHVKNVKFNGGTFINNQASGTSEIEVDGCELHSNMDYVIRTSGGGQILDKCDYQYVVKNTTIEVDGAVLDKDAGVIYFRTTQTKALIENCTVTKKNITCKDDGTFSLYDIYNKNTNVTVNGKDLPSGPGVEMEWLL